MKFLNDYAGLITLIQTIATIILSVVTICFAYRANKIAKKAIEVSERSIEVAKEAAALPFRKEVVLNSYLDTVGDKYRLNLRILNTGNMAIQLDEIYVYHGEGSRIEYVEADDELLEIHVSNEKELAHIWKFKKYILPQTDVCKALILQNCSYKEAHDLEHDIIHIVVRDSEGREYRCEQTWGLM